MAKPIVYTDTSVLAWPQWQDWKFRPVALNAPTSWVNAGDPPPGMTFDGATGEISGAVTTPGIYHFLVWPVNADGQGGIPDAAGAVTALPLHLVIAIWPTILAPNSALNLEIDVQTGAVALTGATLAAARYPDGEEESLYTVKADDDRLIFVRFVSQGVYLELELEDLAYALKRTDPEKPLVISTAGFLRVGYGQDAYYILHVKFARHLLKAALSDYEGDRKTAFQALAEIQWKEKNLGFGWDMLGPATLTRTTQTIYHEVVRDIITT